MAQNKITIARPYAEAVLSRAQETDSLDLWSEMLSFMSMLAQTPEISDLIGNPRVSRAQMETALLEVCGSALNGEGQNLLRVLVRNSRVSLLPDIYALYETRKRECQGALQVQVRAAFVLDETQEQILAGVLQKRLGRMIEIASEQDPDLLGGILIRAGDLVIDGSVRGQLHQLANQLRL